MNTFRLPPPRQLALCAAFKATSEQQGTPFTAVISSEDLVSMTGLSPASVKLGITDLIREGAILRKYRKASRSIETTFDPEAVQFQLIAVMEATS